MPGKECDSGEEQGLGSPGVPQLLTVQGGSVGQGRPWWCGGNKKEQADKREKQKCKEETFVGIEDQRGWKRGVYFFHSCKLLQRLLALDLKGYRECHPEQNRLSAASSHDPASARAAGTSPGAVRAGSVSR